MYPANQGTASLRRGIFINAASWSGKYFWTTFYSVVPLSSSLFSFLSVVHHESLLCWLYGTLHLCFYFEVELSGLFLFFNLGCDSLADRRFSLCSGEVEPWVHEGGSGTDVHL